MKTCSGVYSSALALALTACCVSQAAAQPVPMAPSGQPPVLQPMGDPPELEELPQPKDRVRLQFDDSSIVLGELPLDASVTIKSRLGEFKVKLVDVARIDRAVEPKEFRVIFAAGDRVTGALDFSETAMKTSWGQVPLSVKGLVSMETGKLHSRPAYQARLSPDGRTTVTLRQDYSQFEPQVANPDHAPQMSPRAVPASSYDSTTYPSTAPRYSAPAPTAPTPAFAP